jgi:hypothetical protein
MNGINELALMFKERNNEHYLGPITGTVISPPPEIKISCFNGSAIFDKSKLIIAASVLNGYTRKTTIDGVSTTAASSITKIEGELSFTDKLASGDEVILIPTQDKQTYFVIDKAVRL